jgi:serine/threonine protein kinase
MINSFSFSQQFAFKSLVAHYALFRNSTSLIQVEQFEEHSLESLKSRIVGKFDLIYFAFGQLLRSVAFLHHLKFTHNNLKPTNIFYRLKLNKTKLEFENAFLGNRAYFWMDHTFYSAADINEAKLGDG